jgi:hypothetical protein
MRVPDMVLKHIPFLNLVKEELPLASVKFLFPTHEIGKSTDAVRSMYSTTREMLSGSGFEVMEMIEYAPEISEEEQRMQSEILNNLNIYAFLLDMVIKERSKYYTEQKISEEERRGKVIKLVAEFLALGQVAVSRDALVCCVTTGRIRCLTHIGAGVLHNPVGSIM